MKMKNCIPKLIDNIQKYQYFIFFVFSLVICFFYHCNFFNSARLYTSDVLTVSSIILGILGVFVGLLISMKDSYFFNQVKLFSKMQNKNGKEVEYFKIILNLVKNNFAYNLLFILLTLLIDFIKSGICRWIKLLGIFIWFYLLFLILWGIYYIVTTIIIIELFEPKKSNRKSSS